MSEEKPKRLVPVDAMMESKGLGHARIKEYSGWGMIALAVFGSVQEYLRRDGLPFDMHAWAASTHVVLSWERTSRAFGHFFVVRYLDDRGNVFASLSGATHDPTEDPQAAAAAISLLEPLLDHMAGRMIEAAKHADRFSNKAEVPR
jgi:hypothetical protein